MRNVVWLAVVVWLTLSGCPVSPCTALLGQSDIDPDKKDDSWLVSESEGLPLLLFTSPSGIGGATVTFPEGFEACRFDVGLRYASGEPFGRLEGFEVSSGSVTFRDPPQAAGPLYMTVHIPEEAFGATTVSLEFQWVDMYRF